MSQRCYKYFTYYFELITNLFCLISMNEIHIYFQDQILGESFALVAESVKEAKDLIKIHFEEFHQKPFLVKSEKFWIEKEISNYAVNLYRSVK